MDDQQQEPQEAAVVDNFTGEYASILEAPIGPLIWRAEFGCYVRSFSEFQNQEAKELYSPTWGFLKYHVPVVYRGIYRVADLEPSYTKGIDWRVDDRGFVKCTSTKKDGNLCEALAQHRSAICPNHGARLHPYDKRPQIDEKRGAWTNADSARGLDLSKLTRWQQLLAGHISVEDLDDEELSRGQCRNRKGTFDKREPAMVPKALHDQMMKMLLSRAQEKFRQGLYGAIDALVEISSGTAYEPADRIKAASMIIDRVMGKNPDVIQIAPEAKAWEVIFDGISRDPSADNSAYKRLEAAVDAEVVEVDGQAVETYDVEKPEWGPSLNPGQYRNELKELPPLTDFGVPNPDKIGPWSFPPDDPLARESYELAKQETATLAEDYKEAIKKARSKRYAARSQGKTDLTVLPYSVSQKTLAEPTDEYEGLYQIKFIPPEGTKVPPHLLGKETRRRRYERDRRA